MAWPHFWMVSSWLCILRTVSTGHLLLKLVILTLTFFAPLRLKSFTAQEYLTQEPEVHPFKMQSCPEMKVSSSCLLKAQLALADPDGLSGPLSYWCSLYLSLISIYDLNVVSPPALADLSFSLYYNSDLVYNHLRWWHLPSLFNWSVGYFFFLLQF